MENQKATSTYPDTIAHDIAALTTFRPIGDLIIIKRDEASNRTKGGLYIPEQAQEQLCTGYVVAVGDGNWHKGERVPVDIKTGDHVLFSKHANLRTKINGVEYLTLHEPDIVGVLDDESRPGDVEFEVGQQAVTIDRMLDR